MLHCVRAAFPVSLCLCPLHFIKADYAACRPCSPASWPPNPSCCLPAGHPCRGAREGGKEDQLPPATVFWCLAERATPAPCFAGPSGPSGWRGGHQPHATSSTCLAPGPVWPIAFRVIQSHACILKPQISLELFFFLSQKCFTSRGHAEMQQNDVSQAVGL